MSAKGYVVRGKDDDGKAWAVYAKANVSGWRTHTDATESRDAATLFETPDEAARSAADFRERFGTVAIFAVAEDGTETALPSYEEALAALSQTQDLLSKATDDVLRMSAEIERMRGAAKDMAFALAPWKYEGSIEGPGANDVVMKHRALCWVLFGEAAPPLTEEERDAWQARRVERQKARTT